MADRFAINAGNWSNTAIWSDTAGGAGGASVPTTGDAAHLNNRTVTVDTDITCDSITTRALNGATAGGTLTITANRTVNAAIWPGSTTVATISTVGLTVNFNGEIQGSSTTASSRGVTLAAASTMNITGNCIGGTGAVTSASAVFNNTASGIINIIGDCSASNTNVAVNNALAGTINVTGNVYGCSAAATHNGIINTVGGTITVTGNAYGSDLYNGIASPYASGAHNASTGVLEIIGSAFGGKGTAPGASNAVSGGTLNVTRAVGGPGGPGMAAPVIGLSVGILTAVSGGITYVKEIEFGNLGMPPAQGPVRFTAQLTNVCRLRLSNNSTKDLVDPNNVSGLVPIEADVREGVTYAGGANEGTLAVAPASSVAAGVPTDNTVGTAVITIPILLNVVGQLLSDALTTTP